MTSFKQPLVPLDTVARLLYIALSYTSRETRIRAMLNSTDAGVSMLASQLKYAGYLTHDSVTELPRHFNAATTALDTE